MAHSRTALKRVRQAAKRRALNRWRMRVMREAVKKFNDRVLHGTAAEAKEAYADCQKVIDRTAQRGVIHKNNAARQKSRLVARLKAKQKAGDTVVKSGKAAKPAKG